MSKFLTGYFKKNSKSYKVKSTKTTEIFNQYNFFLYPFPGVHELYWTVFEMFHACLSDHHGRIEEKFVMQSWINVFEKGQYIDWHSHTERYINSWHGFFCLNVEPDSFTSYKWENDPSRKDLQIDITSKNNLIVMGISNGDLHKSSVWNHKEPRITIAFDIVPVKHVYNNAKVKNKDYLGAMKKYPNLVNHWVPI